MGCIFSRKDMVDDSSYVYDTEMPNFSHVREPPVSPTRSRQSVVSKAYFQQFVKRDNGQDAAYTQILE